MYTATPQEFRDFTHYSRLNILVHHAQPNAIYVVPRDRPVGEDDIGDEPPIPSPNKDVPDRPLSICRPNEIRLVPFHIGALHRAVFQYPLPKA